MTFHVLAAEAFRRAAAIHRRVAAAEHDHALADLLDVAEGNARQPIDADVDVCRSFLAAGNIEVTPARRAAADEDRIKALAEQRLQAVDVLAGAKRHAETEDVADFLVDDRFGQAEARNLRADHAARARVAIEHRDVVSQWREIARDSERGGACSDEGDALAVLLLCRTGEPVPDVVLVKSARRASTGRSQPAPASPRCALRRVRDGKRARTDDRRCGRESRGRHSTSS